MRPKEEHRLLTRILVALLLVWIVVAVTASQLRMSPTFDEQNHVTRGIAILRTGDYRLCFHHPPLANILQGLPVAWLPNGFSTSMPSWKTYSIWEASHTTIWSKPHQGIRLITLARIPVLLFTIALALLIFAWSSELFGQWGGVVSLALFAFDPNILAHSGLATTDIPSACTILLAMFLLRRHLLMPTRWSLPLTGVGIGLALATKFTALILLPMLALILLMFAFRPLQPDALPISRRVLNAVKTGVLMLLIAGITLWAMYGFKVEALGSKPGQSVAANAPLVQRLPIPAFQYLRGLKLVATEAEGHRAFLMGQVDTTGKGWWYYFPVAIATKTPIPELLLMLGGLVLVAIPPLRKQLIARREVVFLLVPVIFFALAGFGIFGVKLNIGIRHILPMYPFLLILAGAWTRLPITARWYPVVIAIALVLQEGAVLPAQAALNPSGSFPNYLTYFNEAAEMNQDGYHLLVDSNYDWGQDLATLARVQKEEKLYPLYLSYFGSTPPEAYGIKYRPLPGFGLLEDTPMPNLRGYRGYVAISVSNLMMAGDELPGIRRYQGRQDFTLAGKSIHVHGGM